MQEELEQADAVSAGKRTASHQNGASGRGRTRPGTDPSKVFEDFVARYRANDNKESSLDSYRSAWNQFTEWMAVEGYETLDDLSRSFAARHDQWILNHDRYEKKKLSRASHLGCILRVMRSAEMLDQVDSDIVPDKDKWDELTPDVRDGALIRDDWLDPGRGERIAEWVAEAYPGGRPHVLWVLLFHRGLRVSAIHALDVDGVVLTRPDEWPASREFSAYLHLKDRPSLGSDTDDGLPLKNTNEEYAGRLVPLGEHASAIASYIDNGGPQGAIDARKEHGQPDKYGFRGLLTGEQNARLSKRAIRNRTHWLTCPTTYTDGVCDCHGCTAYREEHDRNPRPSDVGRVCEKSYSPHEVRHGAITRLLDEHSHEDVARIVGTGPDTLRDVYDRADKYRELERLPDGLK